MQKSFRFQEAKLEKLEAFMAVENPITYEFYNETIRALKVHCTRYLHMLDTGKYENEGGTTELDRHRVNLCHKNIKDILKRIKINGELPNNNYMRIAMIHAHHYLEKLRSLCEDVSHQYCAREKVEFTDNIKIINKFTFLKCRKF